MRKNIQIFKIMLSNKQALTSLLLCVICCIGAFIIVKIIKNVTIANLFLIFCSMGALSGAGTFSQYYMAVRKAYEEVENEN